MAWNINSNIFHGYPHVAEISKGYNWPLPFSFSENNPEVFGWKTDANILNGYPYVNYVARTVNRSFAWDLDETEEKLMGYPSIIDTDGLYDFLVNYIPASGFQWFMMPAILNGYPHSYWEELNPPYKLPRFESMSLNSEIRYVGINDGVTVTLFALKHIYLVDVLVVEILDYSGTCVFFYEQPINQEGNISTFSHTVPGAVIETLEIGVYSVNIYIKRTSMDFSETLSRGFEVIGLPTFSILSVTPANVMKPINNESVAICYEITGQGIKQATNTFIVDDNYLVTDFKRNEEIMIIESETEASRMDTLNFDFDVTDPNFILKSVKFKFGAYTSSTTMRYIINGTTYLDGTFSFPGWIEYVSPTGIHLPAGSRRIQVYCPPSWFYPYSTANKPTVPGMKITSATVYAMELVYTISSSGIEGEHTVVLTLGNDDINTGIYPILYKSEMLLEGDTPYEINGITNNMLTVSEMEYEMPEINITHLIPNMLTKPITPGNNVVAINYEIINPDELEIVEMINTFTIDKYSISETKKPITNANTVVLILGGDDIAMGDYPVSFESTMSLSKGAVHESKGVSGNLLNIAKPIPVRDPAVYVSSTQGTAGNIQPLTVIFSNVQYIVDGDEFTIQMFDGDKKIYEYGFLLNNSVYPNINITVDSSVLSSFASGTYNVNVFILREGSQYCTHEFDYLLEDVTQNIIITSISPPAIQKTIIGKNNKVTINYEVVGEIRIDSNKFKVGGYSVTESNLDFTSNAVRTRTVHILLDDTIQAGLYPIELESTVTINGSGSTHIINREIGMLEIIERDDFNIGAVVLSYSGRYIGAETDIVVGVTGLEHIQSGDMINIIMRDETTVFFQRTDYLARNQDAYGCLIGEDKFVGLAVGEYRVEVEIIRGVGIVEAVTSYHVMATPTITLSSVNPNYVLLPFTYPITVQTAWAMSMSGENKIEGNIRIMGTMFSNTLNLTVNDSDSFNLNIHGVSGLAENVFFLQYFMAVTHDIYGTVNLSGVISSCITVLGLHMGEERKSFDAAFCNVNDLSKRPYSIKVSNLMVSSSLYGIVPLNIIYDNVIDVVDIPIVGAKFDDLTASVRGRYVGNELNNMVSIRIMDLGNAEANDIIRISFLDETAVYYTAEINIDQLLSSYATVIPASIFASVPIGGYSIQADIMRGTRVLDTREIGYKVAAKPTIEFVDVSQDYISLPIFMPVNIIANFTVRGEEINAIQGELEFGKQTFSNLVNNKLSLPNPVIAPMTLTAFSAPATDISIAIRNIFEIPSGSYPIDTKFTVESSIFGKANLTAHFDNVITVPNIVTQGAETKYNYDLILCKSNRQQIAFIECFDLVYNPMFLEYNKLSFSIYREIVTEDGVKVLNPIWGKVLSDYQVLLNIKINESIVYTEYFVVENPNMSYDGLDQLTFQAYSYEKVFLNNGNLSGFKDSVKRLFDVTNSIGSDNLPHGILNYILKMKWYNCWTLRHVDGSVLERERVLSFTGNNMRYVIDTLEESFNCVFVFDNVNMTLDIYERSIGMLGNNRGLVIADDNYMTSISYQEDTAGIKTRVTVFGKNGGVISRYNPTGQLYVDDFSYYANLHYMSQELIDALNAYNVFVASKDGVWTSYVTRLDNNDLDVQPLIDALRRELAWENHFTVSQIRELTPFIKEDTVTINTISDGKELYRYALRHIKTTAFVPIQISVDIPDLFALEENRQEWLKFRIGDFANIYRMEYGLEYKEMRLISYEHNPIKNTLRLEFSNKDELITMQWLNNMFFYQLENLQTQYENERDWYIEMPEFSIDDPNLLEIVQNIVDNSVTEITNNTLEEIDNRIFNSITEVLETKVLSAETAHILNAWIRYLCVDMLETNFEALDLRSPIPANNTRYYIRIQGVNMEHIEAQLSPVEIEDYKTPFGDQIFWTSINDHPQAYKYFTITDPMSVHPGTVLTNPLPPGTTHYPPDYEPKYRPMTEAEIEELRELFRVKVRKTIYSSVKKSDSFEPLTIGERTIMIPKTIWGGGSQADRGQGFQYKDLDSFNFTYTIQKDAGNTPAGTEIGISIRDDGCWYFDVEANEWKLIGGLDLDDDDLKELITDIARNELSISGSHIILDGLPTQAQIDTFPDNAVVLVYDANIPYVPVS